MRKKIRTLALVLALVCLGGCAYEEDASPTAAYDGTWYFAQNGAQCQFGNGVIYRDDKSALDGQTLTGIYSASGDHIDANLAQVGGVDQVRPLYIVDAGQGDVLCDSADGTGTVYFYREATAALAALETGAKASNAEGIATPEPTAPAVEEIVAVEPLAPLDTENTTSPLPDARSLPEATPSTTPESAPSGGTVWVSQSGSKYHRDPSCSGMKSPSQLSLSQAQSRGYTPCKRCY